MGNTGSQQTTGAPCISACPIHIDVPRYVRLVAEGKPGEAASVIRQMTPFAAVLGHVCFAPCEDACRRCTLGGAVAIRALKCLAMSAAGAPETPPLSKSTGKKVAIVGSGPAGLTAGYYLARLGHTVTALEALPRAGGMLRFGIPEYRLPRRILDVEIESIRSAGVDIRTNRPIESLDDLFRQGYDAILLATGAHESIHMAIEGEDSPGVTDCLSFLRRVELGDRVKPGKRVAVIGGGNSAIDSARIAIRLGAKEVYVIYRRSRREMPASGPEIQSALDEGVKIIYLAAPRRITPQNGALKLECRRMRPGARDASGRRSPVPVKGSEFTLDFDNVIVAIGQKPVLPAQFELATKKDGTLKVSGTLATARPGVFACGDAATGPASVVEAVAAGRMAAASMDKYLGGKGEIDKTTATGTATLPTFGQSFACRTPVRELPVTERITDFAGAELGFSEGEGAEEARHCLWCDQEPVVADAAKCSNCLACQLACSIVHTGAFNLEKAGITIADAAPGVRKIAFNDNCVRCSVCSRYCTYGALALRPPGEGK